MTKHFVITNKNFTHNKVQFIKAIRATFGYRNMGLKEAKMDIADQFGVGDTFRMPKSIAFLLDHEVFDKEEARNILVSGSSSMDRVRDLTKQCMDEGDYAIAEDLLKILRKYGGS